MKESNEMVLVCPFTDPTPSSEVPSHMRAAFTQAQFSITMASPFCANLGGGRSYAGISSLPIPWEREERPPEVLRKPVE